MSKWAKWRQELEDIGGWDNEFVAVPAGAVRKMIELGEHMEDALQRVADHMPGTPGLHMDDFKLGVESAATIAKQALQYPPEN